MSDVMPTKKRADLVCPECDKAFKSKSGLQRHKKDCKGRPEMVSAPQTRPEPQPAPAENVDGLKKKLEDELTRLQDEYRRQKEAERSERQRQAATDSESAPVHSHERGHAGASQPKISLEELSQQIPGDTPIEPEVMSAPEPFHKHESQPQVEAEISEETLEPEVIPAEEAEKDQSCPPIVQEIEEDGKPPGGPIAASSTQTRPTQARPSSVQGEAVPEYEILAMNLQRLEEAQREQARALELMTQGMDAINKKALGMEAELPDKLAGLVKRIKRLEEDDKKISERIGSVISEIGFGEVIDVSKVPPDILETVYEVTLNDVLNEMRAHVGTQGLDQLIYEILEGIRKQTSGSELFYFDGKKICTRKLATYITRKLISAKQTFMGRLLEYTHNYNPKNFKAMVNLKSQEYAVNNSRLLRGEVDVMRGEMSELKTEIYKLDDALKQSTEKMNKELGGKLDTMAKEITSLKNAEIFFRADISRLLKAVEAGGGEAVDEVREKNRQLEERFANIEGVQNINATRFSVLEKKTLGQEYSAPEMGNTEGEGKTEPELAPAEEAPATGTDEDAPEEKKAAPGETEERPGAKEESATEAEEGKPQSKFEQEIAKDLSQPYGKGTMEINDDEEEKGVKKGLGSQKSDDGMRVQGIGSEEKAQTDEEAGNGETSPEDISEMVLSLIRSGNDTPSGIKRSLEEGGLEIRKANLDRVLKTLKSEGKIKTSKGGRGQRFVPADAQERSED